MIVRKKIVITALCLIVTFLIIGFVSFNNKTVKAYNGITTLTEQQLYNETNTYNVDASCFDILRQNKSKDLRYS